MTHLGSSFYQKLGWLPPAVVAVSEINSNWFSNLPTLRAAMAAQISESGLRKLARLKRATGGAVFLPKIPISLVSNANLEILATTIEGAGLRYGIDLTVAVEPMGRLGAAALDQNSSLPRSGGGVVVVALTAEHFERPSVCGDASEAKAFLDLTFQELELIGNEMRRWGGNVLIQTVPAPVTNILGPVEIQTPGTPANLVAEFNRRIGAEGYMTFDVAMIAGRVGVSNWSSRHYWWWAKLPFHPENSVLYADAMVRSIAALRSGGKKCLVLDLDNTLWGGVIGDAGIDGIEIGNNSAIGEAFLSIQSLALLLKARGVVLAVCSKNERETALEPFKAHAEMLLRQSDIACFVANWNDKASNIAAISEALALGTDSFVFLDDNPMERDLVRREAPEVSVPEIPGDNPAVWPEILGAAGYFDALTFTEEDRNRAEFYASNAQREEVRSQSRDITSYLKGLNMTLVVSDFTPNTRSRVSQLINRSNQFNLTTRRYTEDDVNAMEDSPGFMTFSFRLKDRFGDNGIIAVIIGRVDGETLEIDTWLMSCRVLKRGVEEACLNEIVAQARARGISEIRGVYVPSAKNQMVASHYAVLGFELMTEAADGRTEWTLDLQAFDGKHAVMMVERV